MMPNQIMETWMKLISEASKGSTDAMSTMKLLTNTPTSPDEMVRLMSRFMPAGTGPMSGEALNTWLEEYWRMMGVVPRYRYLEALERNEELRRRLDEAERMLQQTRQFQNLVNTTGSGEDVQKAMGMWNNTMSEMVKMQADWMRAMTSRMAEGQSMVEQEQQAASSGQTETEKKGSQKAK